jgi:hypothetical protein
VIAVAVVAVLVYAAFRIGAGHHHRCRKAQGLAPSFYSSSRASAYPATSGPVTGSGRSAWAGGSRSLARESSPSPAGPVTLA